MIQIDSTLTAASIVALCAVISPLLTAIINNRYQLKFKKWEFEQLRYENTTLRIHKTYEDYLRNVGRYINCPAASTQEDYGASYFTVLSIAPEELRNNIIAANNEISHCEYEKAVSIIEKITPEIHAILQIK